MKKRKVILQMLIALGILFVVGKPLTVFGDEPAIDSEVRSEKLGEDFQEYDIQKQSEGVVPFSQGYYFWKVTSKSVVGYIRCVEKRTDW